MAINELNRSAPVILLSPHVEGLLAGLEIPPVKPMLYELQTKFRVGGDMAQLLQKPGIEFVARVYQEDFYLPLPGQPEELVRIRKQGNKYTFGYKGAKEKQSGVRTRPKFEVEITEDAAQALIQEHGAGAKQVAKIRDIYQLDGILICADSVVVRRDEEVVPAGQFVELRTTQKDKGEVRIQEVCNALGFDYGERINAAYLDIQLGRKDYTAFPELEDEVSPADLYEMMKVAFSNPRNEAYFSSPLTSGGAKRLYEGREDFSQQIPAIIKLNGEFSKLVAQESEDLVMAYRLTLPHLIGTRQGWKEADYMRFWMYYLSGATVEAIRSFEDKLRNGDLGVNAEVFNDYTAPRVNRIREYEKLVDSFASLLRQQNISINPVNQMLCLPDYQLSVGCSSEVRLAEALGIPLLEVTFDKSHPGFKNRITPIARWILEEPDTTPIPNPSNYVVVLKPPN